MAGDKDKIRFKSNINGIILKVRFDVQIIQSECCALGKVRFRPVMECTLL